MTVFFFILKKKKGKCNDRHCLLVIYTCPIPLLLHFADINDKHNIVNCDGCLCNVGSYHNLSNTLWRFTANIK